ncbi:MbcA/ParS/Xre antitoxin family protein [Phenylobacterium terrae]|uniref:MbcA/ParS/Xre antitoxin family protein n=1 Tax=Phenylobacterium terrae TaxID=2665495 RepID=A0ABW4N6G7_9CAUL
MPPHAAALPASEAPAFTAADLRDPEARRRVSAPAVRLFLRVCDLWDLKVDERRAMLGGISRQTYHNWKAGQVGALTRDQLERISLTLGVLKGLRLVFAEDAHALRWLKSENADAPFAGRSPLAHMTEGGLSELADVRRYLDAWRGVK